MSEREVPRRDAEGEMRGDVASTDELDPPDPPDPDDLSPDAARAHREEGPIVDRSRLKHIVESLLLAADKPLTVQALQEVAGETESGLIRQVLEELAHDYKDRGIVVQQVAGGFQFRTHPDNAAWVKRLLAGRPVRLTRAQLETLAVIAYRQPVTRPEIEEIRGVDCGGPLRLLLERNLVRVLGKKEEPGRPLLYGTTREFLSFFNLATLRDLPTLREFHELSSESLRKVEELEAHDQAGASPFVGARGGDSDDQGGGDESSSGAVSDATQTPGSAPDSPP